MRFYVHLKLESIDIIIELLMKKINVNRNDSFVSFVYEVVSQSCCLLCTPRRKKFRVKRQKK
jgi:hypothetical protein